MDFFQIQQGDYASLLGDWQEVATSGNHSMEQGVSGKQLKVQIRLK